MSKKSGLSSSTTFVLSGISACTAELVVYPMDMIKTRLQVMEHPVTINKISSISTNSATISLPTSTVVKRPGMISTGAQIFSHEGIRGFYIGFSAACYRHIVYSGVRYLSYELLRENIFHRNPDGSFPLWKSMCAAMTAGAIGQFVASPTDLVKVQMQTEGVRLLKGEAKLYSGTFNCFKVLYSRYGFIGMWRGWLPNVQRAALVQLGDLTAYDISKQKLLHHTSLKDNYVCHGVASIIAGLVSTIMSTPSDVLKTRIMNNPTRYKSTTDCLLQTIKNEGPFALYKGFFPIWARMGPKAMVFYLVFEELRHLVGVKSW